MSGEKTYGVMPVTAETIRLAARLIKQGRLVVIPTDTVYGVAADPCNPHAVASIFAAKRRPAEKSVQVILPSLARLADYGLSLPSPLGKLARAFCPGGFSPICTADENCPFATVRIEKEPSPLRTQAIRIPDAHDTLLILEATGPLATSSANLSGNASPQTVEEARQDLGTTVALYLDGGPTPGPIPSTVVAASPADACGIRILRNGSIPADKLLEQLNEPVA